jgi:hypothetical protein
VKTLYQIEQDYSELLNRLDEAMVSEMSLDDLDALNEALAINQAEFAQKAEAFASVIGQKKARAEYLRAEAKRLTSMAQADEAAADKLKERIAHAMQAHGLEKAETAHYKLGWRKSARVEITSLEDLPLCFVRVKHEADKTAIKKALDAGQQVSGAGLVESKSLSIR